MAYQSPLKPPMPPPQPGPIPPFPPQHNHKHTPRENLPVYPGYATEIYNGVKYKVYYETDWHQVLTEDGVPLCELLRDLPLPSKENFYQYKGVLRNMPGKTGIEQLYAKTCVRVGDVYLVETSQIADGRYVCEVYVWLGADSGWVFHGTTNRRAMVRDNLPAVLRAIPEDMGDPEQILIVSKDGTRIVWGDPVKDHNEDDKAHQDIRRKIEEIEIKAGSIKVFNALVSADNWTYNSSNGYFEYIFQDPRIPSKVYFEMTPIIDSKMTSSVIANAHMVPVYQIECMNERYPSYAILRSMFVPQGNIPVNVKIMGAVENLYCNNN